MILPLAKPLLHLGTSLHSLTRQLAHDYANMEMEIHTVCTHGNMKHVSLLCSEMNKHTAEAYGEKTMTEKV